MCPPVGKSGPFTHRHSCNVVRSGVVEQLDQRGDDFVEVVRRDVGGHAHGNARAAVDQQVGYPRRQHHRLGLGAVVTGTERHRLLLDLLQHFVRKPGETTFGVAHGGGAIAIERAEIARSIDQRIAQRKRLRHADERFVNRAVTVRMEAAHDVTDDFGALAMFGGGRQILLPHREENAPLHRLEPVTHVGQRPRRDYRQRVVQVARLRGFVQRDVGGAVAADGGVAALPRWRGNTGGIVVWEIE